MTQSQYIIAGAVAGAWITLCLMWIGYRVIHTARNFFTCLRALVQAVERSDLNTRKMNVGIQEQLNLMRPIRQALEDIAAELAYMRTISQPPPVASSPEPMAQQQQTPVAPGYPSGFPAPIYDRFQIVPDAKPEDTDMNLLRQEDEDFADIEKIENLRDQGIEVEDDDVVHPGVEVEAP